MFKIKNQTKLHLRHSDTCILNTIYPTATIYLRFTN